MKVLLVDDSKMVQKMVGGMLEDLGYEVLLAGDGLVAKDVLLKSEGVGLILLDLNMPNQDGLAFLEQNARETFLSCPVIMMTTENRPEVIQKILDLGVLEYIMKPFTQDILESKLGDVLGKAA